MKVRDRFRVTLEDIALGGKALARVDGKVVFVDRGLPGDEVTVQITKTNRRFAEARLVTVEQPSPARQAARCAHVDQCGGCRFQELPYEAQAALKERQVREALQHLGGIADPPVRPIVPAPAAWHYRNKMEYSFMPRPETAADGTVTEVPVLGMHERGRFDRVFELRECLLPSPLTLEIVHFTQAFARTHGWRADHPTRHDGVARSLVVRHLPHTASCAVHLIAASDELPGLAEWARGVAALETMSADHPYGEVLAVSHAGLIFQIEHHFGLAERAGRHVQRISDHLLRGGVDVQQRRPTAPDERLLAVGTGLIAAQRKQAMIAGTAGFTAMQSILALEHAGLTGARLYPGSWSEWCSDPARPVGRG